MDEIKIGLVTFYKDNFGSILQCYATKYFIEHLGYDCDVLFEIGRDKEGKYIKRLRKGIFLIINFLHDPPLFFRWKRMQALPFQLTRETWNCMDNFVDEVLKPVECTWEQLVEKGKKYKAFIVGSDQVWNAYNSIPPIQFLKFSPDVKKIAFAVSFGTDKPSKRFLNIISHGIKGFKSISVREESGKKIVNQVAESDIQVERIADPTLMLDSLQWLDFCREIKIPHRKYILVHFLDYPNNIAVETINDLREKSGLSVICIAYKYDLFKRNGWNYVDCGPKEYVAFINKASYICTDSFHTTLFSINLGKEFLTFERQYLHAHPQTNRITELLNRFGLEDRYRSVKNFEMISDMSHVGPLLEEERENTRNYLLREIKRLDE